MKNYILTLISLLVFTFVAGAQDAVVATVEMNKVSQPCVKATYIMTADIIEGALKKKFNDAKLGSGSKGSDGFRVLKGVVIPEITKEKMDVYYKVEDKKPNAVVYILISKGYDNFMKMDPDSIAIRNTIIYMNLFVKDATAYFLNNEIDKQQDVVKDLEKDARKLSKQGESLLKDKAKEESRISENAIETGGLKNEMENEQKALEQVKTKTATIDQVDALKKEVNKQESLTKKATKNYDRSVKNGADYKEDLAKTTKAIEANKNDQENTKNTIDAAKKKVDELKDQLNNLK